MRIRTSLPLRERGPSSSSRVAKAQSSANATWSCDTTGPVMRKCTSRTGCRGCVAWMFRAWMFIPPANAMVPSTTSTLRCVRRLKNASPVREMMGRNSATGTPGTWSRCAVLAFSSMEALASRPNEKGGTRCRFRLGSAAKQRVTAEFVVDTAGRVDWVEGFIDSATDAEFDGATCLLTLHFLSFDERLGTLQELRRRLKRGAPLVVAHHSVPDAPEAKLAWFRRWAAFAAANGLAADDADARAATVASRLPTLSPESEVVLLERAGFERPSLFYAAFTFRGWVAYAGSAKQLACSVR